MVLPRFLRWDICDDFNVDPHTGAQTFSHSVVNPFHNALFKTRAWDQQNFCVINSFLHDLEFPYTWQIPYYVNQSEAMHNGTVLCNYEIRRPALNFLKQRQPAATVTRLIVQNANVAGPVTNEWKSRACHIRNNNLARYTRRLRDAFSIDDFHDDVFRRYVHRAGRTLMSDQARITTTVTIRDLAAEGAHYLISLLWIKTLGRNECHAYADLV